MPWHSLEFCIDSCKEGILFPEKKLKLKINLHWSPCSAYLEPRWVVMPGYVGFQYSKPIIGWLTCIAAGSLPEHNWKTSDLIPQGLPSTNAIYWNTKGAKCVAGWNNSLSQMAIELYLQLANGRARVGHWFIYPSFVLSIFLISLAAPRKHIMSDLFCKNPELHIINTIQNQEK